MAGSGEPAGGDFLFVATYLPLRSWRHLVPFLLLTSGIRRHLRDTQGVIAWGARGNPLAKNFWTCSAWKDRASISAFVRAEPHATAVRRMAEWAREDAAFAEWTGPDSAIDWDEALRRLQQPTFYYQKPAA